MDTFIQPERLGYVRRLWMECVSAQGGGASGGDAAEVETVRWFRWLSDSQRTAAMEMVSTTWCPSDSFFCLELPASAFSSLSSLQRGEDRAESVESRGTKKTSQVRFMIKHRWLRERNVLEWEDVH